MTMTKLCQVENCQAEGEEIKWNKKKNHPRGYPLHVLDFKTPHYLCRAHQCTPSTSKPCKDVLYQGTHEELGPLGLAHRGKESETRCLFHLKELDRGREDSRRRRKRKRKGGEGPQEDDEDDEDEEEETGNEGGGHTANPSLPPRPFLPSIYLHDTSHPVPTPIILGRQVFLPTGFLLLVPPISNAGEELQRLVIERWNQDAVEIKKPGQGWITQLNRSCLLCPRRQSPDQPQLPFANVVADRLPAIVNTWVQVDNDVLGQFPEVTTVQQQASTTEETRCEVRVDDEGKQSIRMAELLGECQSAGEQTLVTSITLPLDVSGSIVGDQREARLQATTKLYKEGLVRVLDGLDIDGLSRFEGFCVGATAGHAVRGNELMEKGAGLMIKAVSGSRVWVVDQSWMVMHEGDELLIHPSVDLVWTYSITPSLIHCYHVMAYDWIDMDHTLSSAIVRTYLCFMAIVTGDRKYCKFTHPVDGLEGFVAERLGIAPLSQATGSSVT